MNNNNLRSVFIALLLFSGPLNAETGDPSKSCTLLLKKWNLHLEQRGRIFKLYRSDLEPIKHFNSQLNFQSVKAAISDFNRNRGEFEWTLVDDNESGLMIRTPTNLIGKHLHGILETHDGKFRHVSGVVADVSFGHHYNKTVLAIKTKDGLERLSLKALERIHTLHLKNQEKSLRKSLKPKLSEKAFKLQAAVEMKLNKYIQELNEYGAIRLFFKKEDNLDSGIPNGHETINMLGKTYNTPPHLIKIESIHEGWKVSKEFLSLNPIKHIALWKHILSKEKSGELAYPTPLKFLVKNTFEKIYKSGLSSAQKKSLELFGDSLHPSVKKFLESELDVSGPLKLAIGFIAFQYAYESIVEALQEKRIEKTKEALYSEADYWIELLENDPLYMRIHDRHKKGMITKHEAIEEVFLRRQALEFYLSLRNDLKIPVGEELLSHVMLDPHISPLFPATMYHLQYGAPNTKQMTFADTNPISKQKAVELLNTNEDLIRQRSLIYSMFENKELHKQLLRNSKNMEAYEKLKSLDQYKWVLHQLKNNDLDQNTAKKHLLELAQLQEMLSRWEILGAQRNDLDDNSELYALWQEHQQSDKNFDPYLQGESFPHENIEFHDLMNEPVSSTVGSLYFLRFTAPSLRQQLLRVYSYSRRLTKGRIKNAAKDSSKVQTIIDKSGKVRHLNLPASLGSKAVGFLGSGVIAAEVLVRRSHIKNADEMVNALKETPYIK